MTTAIHNNQLQMGSIIDDDSNYPLALNRIRELNTDEIESVSGGGILGSAITGFTAGGAIGGVIGAAVTGSVAGFNTGGAFLASIGFAAGLGWGTGSYIYKHMVSH